MRNTYKLLAPAHLVRVSFDLPEGGGDGVATFACLPCEDELLHWYEEHRLWVCLRCEQELHPEEAEWVIKRAATAFENLKRDVARKRGGQSRFARWWKSLWQAQLR